MIDGFNSIIEVPIKKWLYDLPSVGVFGDYNFLDRLPADETIG